MLSVAFIPQKTYVVKAEESNELGWPGGCSGSHTQLTAPPLFSPNVGRVCCGGAEPLGANLLRRRTTDTAAAPCPTIPTFFETAFRLLYVATSCGKKPSGIQYDDVAVHLQ